MTLQRINLLTKLEIIEDHKNLKITIDLKKWVILDRNLMQRKAVLEWLDKANFDDPIEIDPHIEPSVIKPIDPQILNDIVMFDNEDVKKLTYNDEQDFPKSFKPNPKFVRTIKNEFHHLRECSIILHRVDLLKKERSDNDGVDFENVGCFSEDEPSVSVFSEDESGIELPTVPAQICRKKKKDTDSDFSDNSEVQEMKAKERGEKKKRVRKKYPPKIHFDADGNRVKKKKRLKKKYDSEGNILLKFGCELCPYKTWLKDHLNKHMQRHNPEYQCPYCEKKLPLKGDLNVHIQRVHTGERPFECKLCNFASVTRQQLRLHHNRHHLGIVPLRNKACKYCAYKAESLGSLKAHVQSVHKINRTELFKCNICAVKTTSKDRYTRHMKAHESGVEFFCNFCGKKFVELQDRKIHEKNHRKMMMDPEKSFKCQFCDKTFSFRSYLQTHEKLHSKNKYWNCRLCGTEFSSSPAFKRHFLRVHENERMYGCEDCGFYTDSMILYKKHLKSESHLSVITLCAKNAGTVSQSVFQNSNNIESCVDLRLGSNFSDSNVMPQIPV